MHTKSKHRILYIVGEEEIEWIMNELFVDLYAQSVTDR